MNLVQNNCSQEDRSFVISSVSQSSISDREIEDEPFKQSIKNHQPEVVAHNPLLLTQPRRDNFQNDAIGIQDNPRPAMHFNVTFQTKD